LFASAAAKEKEKEKESNKKKLGTVTVNLVSFGPRSNFKFMSYFNVP